MGILTEDLRLQILGVIMDTIKDFFASTWNEAANLELSDFFSMKGAFVPSVGTVIVSELGDKTFFIAALMSMKYKPFTVFIGAVSALYVMTFMSALFGSAFPMLVDKRIAKWASILLFFYFGLTQIYTAYKMEAGAENEELVEVEQELGITLHDDGQRRDPRNIELGNIESADTLPTYRTEGETAKNEAVSDTKIGRVASLFVRRCLSPSLWQAFTWTFLAEWGDRSQIATIALATTNNWIIVSLGAAIGHTLCTGLACYFGKLISERVSEQILGYIAGSLFLLFGIVDCFIDEF